VTRQDLAPGYQLVQTAHAMADFGIQYPEEFQQWHSTSNYLACLSVKDEQSLQLLSSKLSNENIKHIIFRESDLKDQITAIAIEPTDTARRICSSFPLALKELNQGLNKHSQL
jgi:hypothetical protein